MKLKEIRIQNFRSFEDQTIPIDDYSCLVGPNGSGKSNVLLALNIFFRNTTGTITDILNLSEEDFHHKRKEEPIQITLTFEDLSSNAQKDFKNYYRQGKLVITAKAV